QRTSENDGAVRAARRTSPTKLLAEPDVVALAERLATCDQPELIDLPAQLLGRTLVVRDLESARELLRRVPGDRPRGLAGGGAGRGGGGRPHGGGGHPPRGGGHPAAQERAGRAARAAHGAKPPYRRGGRRSGGAARAHRRPGP